MSTKEAILKILEIFWNMIREAILRATGNSLIILMLLIIPTIAPIYLISGFMTRQITDKAD